MRDFLFALRFLLMISFLSACGTPVSTSSSSSVSSLSSISSSSSSADPSSTLVIEENNPAVCQFDGVLESEHNGFSGSGYINGSNSQGAKIQWAFNAPQAGSVKLVLHYANGGTAARSAQVSVNGAVKQTVAFSNSTLWTDWQEQIIQLQLDAGNNVVMFASSTADGLPNIDRVEVTGLGISSGDCSSVNVELPNVTVWIAGDSTVSTYTDTASTRDQAGWGQMLHERYNNKVTIQNKAIGGRTSRRFIDEGRLDEIWNSIRPGDYFLVQFGTNDGHKTATYTINGQQIPYYLDPNTDFKQYLTVYIDGARARGAIPVLVTPPPRNSAYCTGGNGTGAHAQAMRELAAQYNVALVDLNNKMVNYLIKICPSPTPEDFFLLRADGTVDGTHFQENGARIMSSMVADGIAENNLALNNYRQ